MSLLPWVLMAAAVGWLAGLIVATDERTPMKNLLVGVTGALLGDALARALGLSGLNLHVDPSPYAVGVSLAGATAVLVLANAAHHGEARLARMSVNAAEP